uniref:Uncharacterized protein n=1 Tax=Tetranychus urticae TaxID=32264 RepID=T1KDG3_TETUR
MIVLKPGFTLPMYQYLPLINQRLGASLYDRKGSGKPWKDKDNYDLGIYGNEKPYGMKKKPGKAGLTEAMKNQMMNMMNEMQEQEQPSFIEMILTDPTFPYILPIIIVVSLACILVPLTGWLFTGFLTDNFAYLDGKNSARFNHTIPD